MSGSENTQTEPTLPVVESVDVRAELKKNLAKEFATALSEQQDLTDSQRAALVALVNADTASATSILQTLTAQKEQD